MNDPEKMTVERFQLLWLVYEICAQNKFKVAPVQELINIITSERNVKSVAVRKMVWELGRGGYLENPLRGCWRLTQKGKQLLKEIQSNQERV